MPLPIHAPAPPRARRASGPALVLALIAASTAASAQSYEPPRALALAGADLALAVGNDALYRNPAGIAYGNFYSIELGYEDDFQGSDRRVSGSITDSHEKRVAGGVGYVYRDHLLAENGAAADLRSIVHRIDVALASQLSEGLAIGLSGRYITATSYLGEAEVDPSGFSEFTFDAALAWRGSSGLSLAVVGTNLANSDRPELPIQLGGGIGFAREMFGVEVDVRHDFVTKKPWFGGSASLLIGGALALRAGFAYDLATESSAISVGVGFQNPQFAADLAFRQRVSGAVAPGLDGERLFALALRGIPFL